MTLAEVTSFAVESRPDDNTASAIVARVVQSSAWRSERTLAVARMVFCSVLLVRTLLVTTPSIPRFATGLPPMLAAIAFSLYVLAQRERPQALGGFLLLSVAIDAASAFGVLLPMALWPELPGIPLLDKADISGLLLVVSASAFRHSVSASAASCLLNTVSFVLLMRWDRAAPWTEVEWHVAFLYLVFLLGMGSMAALLARRTRELVTSSARTGLAARCAQENLALILRDHHDLRSQLSSATLNADLAEQEVVSVSAPNLRTLIARIRLSLNQINSAVCAIKERSYEELARDARLEAADLEGTAESVVRELAPHFPSTRFQLQLARDTRDPWVIGGDDGLRRLLLNLVSNACEGSGAESASTVVVQAEPTPRGDVRLVVHDDGPGFGAAMLAAKGRARRSSKADGFGLGLALVRRIAEASGGRVTFANAAGGGARVEVVLPGREHSPVSSNAANDEVE